ncbi:MAG: heat-shock protein [Bacteroidetes bacterium]|nr:MAG: heat-shock protein [Bacteroidota bacterium]PTM12021.1 MAG: heat-shock protein [Bacteroidota bacterium]
MLPVTRNLLPTVSRFLDDDWNGLFDWTNRNFSNTATTLPSVNIKEEADQFVVEMAAPGMKKSDFQIELNNNVLTIRSEVQRDEEEKTANGFLRREFSYQSFQRSFNLNNKVVDDAKIKATYQDGILRLNLPKKEEAKEKPARLIKIS